MGGGIISQYMGTHGRLGLRLAAGVPSTPPRIPPNGTCCGCVTGCAPCSTGGCSPGGIIVHTAPSAPPPPPPPPQAFGGGAAIGAAAGTSPGLAATITAAAGGVRAAPAPAPAAPGPAGPGPAGGSTVILAELASLPVPGTASTPAVAGAGDAAGALNFRSGGCTGIKDRHTVMLR